MDAYEATRIVFSRIQNLDPENASKIMGLLLIKDHGEKEMIRLAFGPESLLHSLIIKARTELGISSNTCSTPSTPSSPSPFFSSSNPNSLSNSSFSSTTTTVTASNPIPITTNNNTTSSTSISTSRMLRNLSLPTPSSWGTSVPSSYSDFQNSDDFLISPNSSSSLSYAAAMNGFNNSNMNLASSSADLIDDFQLQEQLSFLNEKNNNDFFYPSLEQVSSPSSNSDGMLFPNYAANWGNTANNSAAMSNGSHSRSCSVTDICMGTDPLGSGFGWKPCLYYNRGYCKNGTTCRFFHGDSPDSPSMAGSPSKIDFMEQCQELLRSKAAQQQQQQQQMRLNTASQLLGTSSLPYTSVAGKCMNFLLQQQQNDNQRAAAAALLLREDMQKFGRNRMERSEFSSSGGGMINPGSRQIYLTFPADSTFREEDVSNYFSIYGPVQDVRIPYQQKRMFGFVTFVYPETVKLILAKGNPHFVCDARVLVKPYKEKGKVPDKKQQNQGERGEYSSCTTPTGLDSRDPYDLQQLGGARMCSNQDLLFRRKLEEQAELQQAIDMQSRRLMGLQLLDIKKHHHHRNLSMGAIPIPSPTHSHTFLNQTLINSMSSPRSSESCEEDCGSPAAATSHGADQLGRDQHSQADQHSQQLVVNMDAKKEELIFVDNVTEEKPNGASEVHDGSSEHNLPDSPFASGGDASSFFSTDTAEAERSIGASSVFSSSLSSPSSIHSNVLASSLFPPTSTLDMASFKSCFFPMPRFSSGQGAIEM